MWRAAARVITFKVPEVMLNRQSELVFHGISKFGSPFLNSSQSLFKLNFSKFSTFSKSQKIYNRKVTVNITMKAHSLDAPYLDPTQRFSKNSEKFTKLQGDCP